MQINSLKLQNFRSYKKAEVSFGRTNIIVGENAQGKTNLLEAIYLMSVGKSFRAKEKDVVKWGESFFRIEAQAESNHPIKVEFIYEKEVGRGRKTIKINNVKKPTISLLESFKCVFFTPDEIDMFFAFPSLRRRHINIIISQIDKEYARDLVKYKRILAQRNTLLKRIADGRCAASELEIWDGRLAECGAKIMEKRAIIVKEINKTLSENYKNISGAKDKLTLKYEPSVSHAGDGEGSWGVLVESLLSSRERDIAAKATTKGPHRDDFSFFLEGRAVVSFASRGEMRSFVIALKFSERDVLEDKTGEKPVLLLDDVFSELDEFRRKKLVESFKDQQTITTTTDLDHIDKSLRGSANIFTIERNSIQTLSTNI